MRLKLIPPLLLLLFLASAWAQNVTRVLVLPFDTVGAAESYGLGLAVGLQRSLNTIDGVYVPPVGDGALFVSRAHDVGLDSVAEAVAAFTASAVVSGSVSASSDSLAITLAFTGSAFPEPLELTFESPAEPVGTVMRRTVDEVVAGLGLTVTPEQQQALDSVATRAPSLASLEAVGWSAAGLNPSLSQLASAHEVDSSSSWVLTEYARALALDGQAEAALDTARRAVSGNPADIEARVAEGVILLDLGRFEEAAEVFAAVLRVNAAHATALTGVAQLLSDPDMQQQSLERAVQAYPRLVEAQLELARLTSSDGRALQLLQRAAGFLPESIPLHRAVTRRMLAAGDPAAALDYLEGTAAKPLARSAALYTLAVDLPDSVSQAALAFVRTGIAAHPDSVLPALAEARLLRSVNQLGQAEARLQNLLIAHPGDNRITQELVLTLAQQDRLSEARSTFEQAGASLENLSELLLSDGQSAAVIHLVEPLASADDASPDLLVIYGQALAGLGRNDAARAAFDRALALDGSASGAERGRDRLSEQARLTGGVSTEFQGAAAAAFQRGLNALGTQEHDVAVLEFGQAYEASNEPLAAFYHGYALQLSGRLAEAAAAYDLALQGYPQSDVILNNLGYTQLQLGRYDLALPTLRSAQQANSSNSQVQLNLGLTYYGLKRYGDAVIAWEAAVALNPGISSSIEALLQDARNRSANR